MLALSLWKLTHRPHRRLGFRATRNPRRRGDVLPLTALAIDQTIMLTALTMQSMLQERAASKAETFGGK